MMDYYLMEPDNNINSPLKFTDYFNFHNKNTDAVIESDITEKTKLIDYARPIDHNTFYHMFSDKIKDVIGGYDENIIFYGVFVTSYNKKRQYAYWRIDTLKLKRVMIENANEIRKVHEIEFSRNQIENSLIFCIVKSKHDYIAVREDLAESILRRCPIGIALKRLAVL